MADRQTRLNPDSLGSGCLDEFGERGGESHARREADAEFIVSAS